jgi:hypothetical protein
MITAETVIGYLLLQYGLHNDQFDLILPVGNKSDPDFGWSISISMV